jgi:hypothetical protein
MFHDFSIIKDFSNKNFNVFYHFLNKIGFLMKGKLNPFSDAAVAKSTGM